MLAGYGNKEDGFPAQRTVALIIEGERKRHLVGESKNKRSFHKRKKVRGIGRGGTGEGLRERDGARSKRGGVTADSREPRKRKNS